MFFALVVLGLAEGLEAPVVTRRFICAAGTLAALAPQQSPALEGDTLELYKQKATEKEKKRAAQRVSYGAPKLEPLSSTLPDVSKLERKATAPPKKPPRAKKSVVGGTEEKKKKPVVERPRSKADAPDVKSLIKAESVKPTSQKIVGGDAPLKVTLTPEERAALRKEEKLSGEYARKLKKAKGEL